MIERIKHIMSTFFDKEAVTECEEITDGNFEAIVAGTQDFLVSLSRLSILSKI